MHLIFLQIIYFNRIKNHIMQISLRKDDTGFFYNTALQCPPDDKQTTATNNIMPGPNPITVQLFKI